jgi:hypothetical protein
VGEMSRGGAEKAILSLRLRLHSGLRQSGETLLLWCGTLGLRPRLVYVGPSALQYVGPSALQSVGPSALWICRPSDLWIRGGRVQEVVVELCGKMFEAWVGGAFRFRL